MVLPSIPFIGSEVQSDYPNCQIVILPVPFELTTTYCKGCENGPIAILEASEQLEYYDVELRRETCQEVKIYTHPAIADTRSCLVSSEEMLRITTATVSRLVTDGKFVITLGGEHSITAGVVKAYLKEHPELFTVIQIDAHGDLRHEYEGSIYNHACVMRRIMDLGLPTLPVGIRSICAEEAQVMGEQGIPVIWGREIATKPNWIEAALEKITTPKVFITIDLDGIDPSLMPSVGTPQPGGLNWYNLTNFLRQVFDNYQVIGCDVMELAPIPDLVVSQFTAAKLVYKLVGYHAISQGW